MSRVTINPIAAPLAYAVAGTTLSWTACNVANGNRVPIADGEILLLFATNDGSEDPVNLTVTSQPDPVFGRTGNISRSIASGAYVAFRLDSIGWATNGFVNFNGDNAAVKVMILKIT